MSDTWPRRWDHYVRDMLGACDKITSYNEGLPRAARRCVRGHCHPRARGGTAPR